jgi:nucleoid-associated protein YgaU
VNPHPVRRLLSAPRTRGLAIAVSALALLVTFCLQLWASNRAAWRSVREPGPASVDEALAAVCGSLALAIAFWLLSAVLLSLLAALGSGSSALSAALTRAAGALAPRVLRNAVAALLGVVIAAAPAAAEAGGNSPGPGSAQVSRTHEFSRASDLSPAWAPTGTETTETELTGPETTGTETTRPGTRADTGPAPTLRSDLFPGWIPPPPSEQHQSRQSGSVQSQPAQSQPARPQLSQGHTGQPDTELTRPERSRSARPGSTNSGSRGTESPPVPSPARRTPIDQDDEVVVRRGDTLWSLAERHLGPGATNGEIAVEWPHWFTANRAVIGDDPDHLVPGERLRPPERGDHARRAATGTAPDSRAGTRARTRPGRKADAGPGRNACPPLDTRQDTKAEIGGAW